MICRRSIHRVFSIGAVVLLVVAGSAQASSATDEGPFEPDDPAFAGEGIEVLPRADGQEVAIPSGAVLSDAALLPVTGETTIWCTIAAPIRADWCTAHHQGWAIDIDVPAGEPIYAAGSGIVAVADNFCDPDGGDGCNGRAGNYVAIDHGGYQSRYLHLARVKKKVKVGAQVYAGEVIGFAGASGTYDGAVHLHYDEIRVGEGRIRFGDLYACHDSQLVSYPAVLGATKWEDVYAGTTVHNDGYDCVASGSPASPPPERVTLPSLANGGTALVAADFDGDGIADLAAGSSAEDIDAITDAGAVVVSHGGDGVALGSDPRTVLYQGGGLSGPAESGDYVGAALAAGDVDCDGLADLVIGSPGEDAAGATDTGALHVVSATNKGLDGSASAWYQRGGLAGSNDSGDLTGAAVATGDFNGDGCDDVAVGAPGEDWSGGADAGAVVVSHGASAGLSMAAGLLQGSTLSGLLESGDLTGAALAVGDFNCDGIDDLAVGAPGEAIDAIDDAGVVLIASGSSAGLVPAGVLYQSSGLPGTPAVEEWTGAALAAGDLDRDGCDDLAVGAPGEAVAGQGGAGAVALVFGSPYGLGESSTSPAQFLTQGDRLRRAPQAGAHLGAALLIVDRGCKARTDLVIGIPDRRVKGATNGGAVLRVGVKANGQARRGSLLRQGKRLPGTPGDHDRTGASLAAGDFDGDGCTDLAIGAPGESAGGYAAAGVVLIKHLKASKAATALPAESLAQGDGLPGVLEAGDQLSGASALHLLWHELY